MEFLNLPGAKLKKTVARHRDPPWLFAFSDGKRLCRLVEDWLCQQPLAGKVNLAKISVDSNRRMFEQFGIVSVPTWIFVNAKVEPVSAWIGPWTRGPEVDGEIDVNALREFLRSRLMR